jgi:hypothetical protein
MLSAWVTPSVPVQLQYTAKWPHPILSAAW